MKAPALLSRRVLSTAGTVACQSEISFIQPMDSKRRKDCEVISASVRRYAHPYHEICRLYRRLRVYPSFVR